MKFAFKTLAATAAFMAASVASAADPAGWQVVSGSGGLTFSSSALSALSASGSSIITAATIPTGFPGAGAANTAAYTKATGNVALTFSDATINGDALTSLSAANSLVNIRRSVFEDDGSVSQYNVFLANFKVNLALSTVSAQLYSSSTAASALQDHGFLTLFQAANVGVVSGGTGGNIVAQSVDPNTGIATGVASGSLSGKLSMNAGTADIILASLGLDTTGDVANLVKNADWGATSASGTFALPAIPEPSTWALFSIGLLAVGAVARRRQAA